jgi:SH3 domain-containing YSC84-like protein 1
MHTPHLRFAAVVRLVLAVAVLAVGVFMPRAALAADERLDLSATVLEEIMSAGDASIPTDLFRKAECVVIVPGLKQGAFVVGAKYGRGFFSCRKGEGWSAPAGVRVEGGSFGFQIGGSGDRRHHARDEQAGRRSAAVEQVHAGWRRVGRCRPRGPHGDRADRRADDGRDPLVVAHARRVRGHRARRRDAREDSDSNRYLYRKRIRNREIITGNIAPPEEATRLMAVLAKY